MWACQPSLTQRQQLSAHPAHWTGCQYSDRFAYRLTKPRCTPNGVSLTLPIISKLSASITVSGMPIALPVASAIFLVNNIRSEQSST
jgi:hypothetical protein